MNVYVQLYRHKRLRSFGRDNSAADFMAALVVSRATHKRVIEKLRDRLYVPISRQGGRGSYNLEPRHADSELPSSLASQEEIMALSLFNNPCKSGTKFSIGVRLRALHGHMDVHSHT